MNLHEALLTANWLLNRASLEELAPEQTLRIRQMRDVLYFLHAAAGIAEIRQEAYELGQQASTEGP